MKLQRRAKSRRGVLALEWVLIITVLVIGIIGGLGLVRNAVIVEMNDLSNSIMDLQVDPNNPQTIQNKNVIDPANVVDTPQNDNSQNDFEAEFPIPVIDDEVF